MNKPYIVVNSGPLILLARIDGLDILGKMPYQFICPPAVRSELDVGPRYGYRPVNPGWLLAQELRTPVTPMMDHFLDRGEAEVIQLALDYGIPWVCLDDLRGRKTAQSMGLRTMGLLALLGKAKIAGVIPRLKPITDKLLSEGAWYSRRVIQAVQTEVGE